MNLWNRREVTHSETYQLCSSFNLCAVFLFFLKILTVLVKTASSFSSTSKYTCYLCIIYFSLAKKKEKEAPDKHGSQLA